MPRGLPGRSLVQVLAPELPAKLPPSASGLEFSREAEGVGGGRGDWRTSALSLQGCPAPTTTSKHAQQPSCLYPITLWTFPHNCLILLIRRTCLRWVAFGCSLGDLRCAGHPQLDTWDPRLQANAHGIRNKPEVPAEMAGSTVFSYFPVLSPFYVYGEKEKPVHFEQMFFLIFLWKDRKTLKMIGLSLL